MNTKKTNKTETLTLTALRYQGLFIDVNRGDIDMGSVSTAPVQAFVARLKEIGFCVSEELLHALNSVPASRLVEITECFRDVMGVKLNWMPLVRGWDEPTGETLADHLVTFMANISRSRSVFKGTTLPCGHFIPEGTFPLERYNGCPFCGKPFKTASFVYKGQASKLKELRLFTVEDMEDVFSSLLSSATPLDGTQKDTLERLLQVFPLPAGIDVPMKETAMLVVKSLAGQDRAEEASGLLKTPVDILRYLWYEKTGCLQVIEPRTLVARARKLYSHMWGPLDRSVPAAVAMKEKLRLKYDRPACLRAAKWLNAVPMSARQAAENMNPKRGMWVRMIRALRLAEYSHKPGFEHLAEILDVFYRQDYSTWQGRLDRVRSAYDPAGTFAMLKERPGCFARSLFATMLRFGADETLSAFGEVADRLPARLLLSLANSADSYFDPDRSRIARPITGVTRRIAPNALLALYGDQERSAMVKSVYDVYLASMSRRFAAAATGSKTIFIDPLLYSIPVSVGDRSATVQDASCALMGMRFPVEGDSVRLFLQWGKGMHAQPLDMDLSCRVTLPNGRIEECAYYNLTCTGAKHSGDIREIPEMKGTAEYIELSLPKLEAAGAEYVVFTGNAYSTGALSANLTVGWMNSAYPMRISAGSGVAYDPSCVQHMVRVGDGYQARGIVFGVLVVASREIVWLEMPFTSQTLRGADGKSVEALLDRLKAKVTVGELLDVKARAQDLVPVEKAEDADEAYTYAWALNPAAVTRLLGA